MDSVNVFDKCPQYDEELKSWSLINRALKEEFSKENKDYLLCLTVLANQCNRDVTDDSVVDYGFSLDAIKEIMVRYKEDRWDITNIEKDIKTIRETANEEHQYINNIIKPWTQYKVPAINTKEHYELRDYKILRYVESVSEDGEQIFYTKDVCRTPFVLCGVSEPLRDDTLYYKIRYLSYGENIKEFWASQSDLLSKNELKKLFLQKGINCPENLLLVETLEYISRSIADFGARLKKEHSTKQCGWNDDKTIFVIGNRAVSTNGIETVLTIGNGKGFSELEIKGTLDGWISGTKEIFEYDLVRFKAYDAFTAPLNAILGLESHITDHYGNTSCGKTFTSWIALSMFGDAEGLTLGAKGSMKGLLVTIRDFSDLPLLIDESSDAGEHLSDLVYPLTSNKGRVTSTTDKQRDGGEEYHTSTMFTGEKPIRDCLPNSGQQYRVNELEDTLPDLPTKKIMSIKQAIRENHGHIIELYVKKTFKWMETGFLYDTYEACFDTLPENTTNIVGRSRAIFAGIMTAGVLLESVFGDIGFPQKQAPKIVTEYFRKCILEKPVELEYLRALRVVLDWVHSDYGRFAKGFDTSEDVTYNDKNKIYGFIDNIYIDIIGTEFTRKMKENGFSPSKIKEDWWNQGISESNDSVRKGTYRFKRDGKTIVGVRINRTMAETMMGVWHEPEDKKPHDQDEKVKRIFKIIEFLTELDGVAKINSIRLLANITDVDEMLNFICKSSKKIMKISQDDYIYLH